jgi:hypothetical protein
MQSSTKAGFVLSLLQRLHESSDPGRTPVGYVSRYPIQNYPMKPRERSRAATKRFKLQTKEQYKREKYQRRLQGKLDRVGQPSQFSSTIRRFASSAAGSPVAHTARRELKQKLLR